MESVFHPLGLPRASNNSESVNATQFQNIWKKGHGVPAALWAVPKFPRLLLFPRLLPDFPEENPKRGDLLPSPGSRQIPGFGILGNARS